MNFEPKESPGVVPDKVLYHVLPGFFRCHKERTDLDTLNRKYGIFPHCSLLCLLKKTRRVLLFLRQAATYFMLFLPSDENIF